MNVARDQWVRSIRAWKPPPQERIYKLTLQSLARVMTPDGVISKPRGILLDASGLSSTRSLERHLAYAVAHGWLRHVRAGVKRTACAKYLAALPDVDHPPSAATDDLSTIRRARRQVREDDGRFGSGTRTPKPARPSAADVRVVDARPSAVLVALIETFAHNPEHAWVFPPGTVRGRLPVPAPPPVEVVPTPKSRCATRTLPVGRPAPYLAGLDVALDATVTRAALTPAALAHQEAPNAGHRMVQEACGRGGVGAALRSAPAARPVRRLPRRWPVQRLHGRIPVMGRTRPEPSVCRIPPRVDGRVMAAPTTHEVDYIPAAGLFVASCGCGWESEPSRSLSAAVVAFTGHRRSSDLMEHPDPMETSDGRQGAERTQA